MSGEILFKYGNCVSIDGFFLSPFELLVCLCMIIVGMVFSPSRVDFIAALRWLSHVIKNLATPAPLHSSRNIITKGSPQLFDNLIFVDFAFRAEHLREFEAVQKV